MSNPCGAPGDVSPLVKPPVVKPPVSKRAFYAMRHLLLASDYDGTLAQHGQLADVTRDALEKLRGSGRKIVLVTGREMVDLERVCPELELFDRIVAENGAAIFDPATRVERLLVSPPPDALVQELQRQLVPLYLGRVVVATDDKHLGTVRRTIHELRLDSQIILNKGAVMVLPPGVDKAFGLRNALAELVVPAEQAVGVGDAENDEALLAACGYRVAVQNALPGLKAQAHWVTAYDHGAGIVELIERLLKNELP
jgi:hydroxymethylpyrimidine pyrophosphatase-like HAD family hydrolase